MFCHHVMSFAAGFVAVSFCFAHISIENESARMFFYSLYHVSFLDLHIDTDRHRAYPSLDLSD